MALANRVALVTGATNPIGRACSRALVRAGVAIAMPLTPHTDHVANQLREQGGVVKALHCDTIDETVDAAFAWRGRLDILVNHCDAGVCRQIEKTEIRHFDMMHGVHCRAALLSARRAIPYMLAAAQQTGIDRPSHIVNIAPPLDIALLPGRVAYSVAKLGMTLSAIGLAEELRGRGVHVNTLWPRTLIDGSNCNEHAVAERAVVRSADVVGDALCELVASWHTGRTLLDEEVLREAGVRDFAPYERRA